MFSSKSEQSSQKSILKIKQDDKFFCKLLSKESSISNPSFRVAITVPFVWESQPGTPKYTFSQQSLPPLTPPPSYYSCKNSPIHNKKNSSKSNLFLSLFPKLNLKNTIMSSSSSPLNSPYYSSSSSSCSSSDSSKVVAIKKIGRRKRFLSFGSSLDFRKDHEVEEEEEATSPTSTLCFGLPRSASTMTNSGFLGFSKR